MLMMLVWEVWRLCQKQIGNSSDQARTDYRSPIIN
jgi:hypothetical protein